MQIKRLIVTLLSLVCVQVHAHSTAHVHGMGTLFLAQDADMWQLQFTFPAADVLGFEHSPQDQQQRDHIEKQSMRLREIENLLVVPKVCKVTSTHLTMPDYAEGHDAHHSDIELTLTLSCQSPPASFAVNVFDSFSTLEKLEVMWATQAGQGQQVITANAATVEFN